MDYFDTVEGVAQTARVCSRILPPSNSIILGTLLNLHMTQFPDLWNGESNDHYP